MLAAGRVGRRLLRTQELEGGGDGAATGMAQDEHELGAGDGAAVFDAAEYFAAQDVAGDAHAENVAQREVEDDFGGGARVDAAENDGHGVLAVGGGGDE